MSIVRKALTILLAVAASLPVMAQQQTEQSDSLESIVLFDCFIFKSS